MSTTLYQVGGQTVDKAEVTAPADRRFRAAWQLDGSVITIDPDAAAEIANDVRLRWWAHQEQQPFEYDDGGGAAQFQSDRDSADRIQGAIKMAELVEAAAPGSFSIDWVDLANVTHTLDFAGIQGLFLALATHTATCFAASQTKKAEIEAARVADDVDELDSLIDGMEADMAA